MQWAVILAAIHLLWNLHFTSLHYLHLAVVYSMLSLECTLSAPHELVG